MPSLKTVESTLEKLSLKRNNISSIPRDYFIGFKKLSELTLTHNLLEQIPDITPLQHSITDIAIDFNKIHSISGALDGTIYPLLKKIALSYNAIRTFSSDMLLFWPVLTHLTLRDNCIVKLPTSYPTMNNRTASIILILSQNPIHCDITVEGITTRRQYGYKAELGDGTIEIHELHTTICASPGYLCGRDLGTLGM